MNPSYSMLLLGALAGSYSEDPGGEEIHPLRLKPGRIVRHPRIRSQCSRRHKQKKTARVCQACGTDIPAKT